MDNPNRLRYSRRAASAALAGAATGLGGGSAFASEPPAPPSAAELDAPPLPVERFGARADRRDNTAALNEAFAHLRAEITEGGPYCSAGGRHFLDFSGGVYRCEGSIDATGITGTRMWGLRFAPGCMIYSEAEGQVALDLYQSRFAYLDNLSVFGSFDAPPAVGLLISHGTSLLNGTGEHMFNRCRINGCFSKAALYNYSCEEALFAKCFFSNGYEGEGAEEVYAAAFTSRNILGIRSAFRDMVEPAASGTTRQTFNGNTALNCEFIRRTTDFEGKARGHGPALLLDDASTFRAWSYVRQWGAGQPAVRLRSSGGLRNLILHLIIEGDRTEDFPHYDFDLDSGVTLRDVEIVDHAHWNNGPLIRIRRGTRRINGLRIRKPLQGVDVFSIEYDGDDTGAKPDIRGAHIQDTSPLSYTSEGATTKPSIRMRDLRMLQGVIDSAQEGFVEPDPVVGNYSGSIAGPAGIRYIQCTERLPLRNRTIETRGNSICIEEAAESNVLAVISKPSTFPFERITLSFGIDVNLVSDGNIRLPNDQSLLLRSRSVADLVWDPQQQAWLLASPS